MPRTRSAVSGKFVDAENAKKNPRETVTEKTATKKKTAKVDTSKDYVFPEVLGNDWHKYVLRLSFMVKRLDDPITIKGVKGKPGDFVFKASDGGVGILTEDELNEHYQAAAPSPAAPLG